MAAVIRFLPSKSPPVYLEIPLTYKRFATMTTLIRFLPSVRPVYIKSSFVVKALSQWLHT